MLPMLMEFSIEGVEYQAEEGMTWFKWSKSSYNTIGLTCGSEEDIITYETSEPSSCEFAYYIDSITGTKMLAEGIEVEDAQDRIKGKHKITNGVEYIIYEYVEW